MREKFRVDVKTGELVPAMDDNGRELPDSVPMAPPIGFVREPPLHERIRAMVQDEYARVRAASEVETPEEADDFRIPGDVEDDPREGRFAMLPGFEDEWEENYNPPDNFAEMRQRLIDAGWVPPKKGQEHSAEKLAKSDEKSNVLDASQAGENKTEPPRGSASES